MTSERINNIKTLFDKYGPIIKAAILRENKVCSRDIKELIDKGYVIKIKTGYYCWNSGFDDLNDFEIVQSIIPTGVISMFSAAVIHEMTTVNPTDVNVTIASRMLKPKLPDYPPVDLFFTSNDNLDLGIEEHVMEHMKVRVYNAERTVCDFFKYSSRVGNDVALEVIKNYMLRKNKNLQLLFEYATKLRVKKYIKSYVEVLL
ncbi:type IV toxin-antitoxin system AbiEi family antitoxin domain-containing protein [Clostridium thermarum]|uniref:type IV toxin-antitoxin system AbiEi family antitoxin domain-containing protein n=1 Tax=Clostridium thermarum TaxID=1716543 RepID=UPI00111FA0A5|nr:hypothetical protein [Clostridium thermarum]